MDKWAWLLLTALLIRSTAGGGFHNDDQQDLLWSETEIQEIRNNLIKSLGLTKVPDMSKVNVTEEEKAQVYEEYWRNVKMASLEKRQNEEEEEKTDIIKELRFPAFEERQPNAVYLVVPVNIPSGRQRVHEARLHLLHTTRSLEGIPFHARPPLLALNVYETTPHQTSDTLVHSRTLLVREKGREALDMTSLLRRWFESSSSQGRGLRVECPDCHRFNVSLVAEKDSSYLEVIVDDDSTEEELQRSKRSAKKKNKNKKIRPRGKKWKASQKMFTQSYQGTVDCKKLKGKCCRHKMYVNFTRLEMDFIKEPKGFDAYYCEGSCPLLYNPAHAHALIQSKMHSLNEAPKPCCAASKLGTLEILFYDENGKLKTTKWANAIVEECACQ